MIVEVRCLREHRCFKPGDRVSLRPGINFLVGDQGSGKSTLLCAMKEMTGGKTPHFRLLSDGPTRSFSYDFERQNCRTLASLDDDLDIGFQLQAQWSSHGEMVNALLAILESKRAAGVTFLLDEPDMALSPRSIRKLIDRFNVAVDNGCQVVAAVHNPLLIASQKQVYCLETRQWKTPKQFLDEQWADKPGAKVVKA